MKTLIVRLNTLLKPDRKAEVIKEIAEGIKIGVLVLDPHFEYEVVEYDSYLTDIPYVEAINLNEKESRVIFAKEVSV